MTNTDKYYKQFADDVTVTKVSIPGHTKVDEETINNICDLIDSQANKLTGN